MTLDIRPVYAAYVARWARKEQEALRKRDEGIRRMRAEGATLREIAKVAGLTHGAIANICKEKP